MTPLEDVGRLGLLSRDITGTTGTAPRGPFTKTQPSRTAAYPALWNHHTELETQLIYQPDCQLRVRSGMEEKASKIWETAGRTHLTRDFRINSQPLAVAFTEDPCIGGTAWPNVNFAKKSWDYAFALWSNSTLELLYFWWHSTRQQSSKARMSIRAAEKLSVLDFRVLSKTQLQKAKTIFGQFKDPRKHFAPAYLTREDKTRELLDYKVLCEWLGFGEDVFKAVRQLAHKWCAEPSVHAGKQRNKNTPLAI